MASYFVANEPDNASVDALVLIGMSAQYRQPQVNSAESLKRIQIPVLDLYGSKDFATVLATTGRRADASVHNRQYRQQVIPNAYHFFDDHEKELISALNNWLDQHFD